jgi:hypothetical protein
MPLENLDPKRREAIKKKLAEKLTPELSEKFELRETTFLGKEKKGTQEIQEIIGDDNQEDFFPQVEAKFWDNECKLSVRYLSDEEGEEIIDTDKEKVKWRKGREEARFYQKPENERHESGEFEFDILLDEYTGKNEWVFSIRTRGLKFYRQEALTPEEIEEGAERPDWITGGYCVYHESKENHVIKKRYTGDWQETPESYLEMSLREEVSEKKKGEKGFDKKIEKGKYYSREYEVVDTTNYATGKVCNIPLPVAIDAKGNETFGTIDVDEEKEEMRVGVSDEWLKKAKYPVTIDPTFGHTTIGSSNLPLATTTDTTRRGRVYTSSAAGTLDSLHGALRLNSAGSEIIDTIAFINLENGGGADIHSEIANSEILNNSYNSTTAAWFTFTTSGESIDINDYIISMSANFEQNSNKRALPLVMMMAVNQVILLERKIQMSRHLLEPKHCGCLLIQQTIQKVQGSN